MAKRRKVTWIDRGWQPVAIGFVPDEDAFENVVWTYKIADQWPGKTGAMGWCKHYENDLTGEALILVGISNGKSSGDTIASIVHESVHAWQFLCHRIGEKSPSIEMEAYGIQHIFVGVRAAYEKEWGKL